MNTRNLAASLLPVVFALASLGTVGCAADSETSEEAATREPSAAVAPVEALAGSAGTPRTGTPAAAPDAQVGKAAASLRLVATDKGNATATYEVLELDFGLDAPRPALAGAKAVSKPVLRPLSVVVRPNAKSSLLGRNLTGIAPLAKVVIQRVAADGTVTDVAQLDRPIVTSMRDVAGDATRETYEIQAAILTATDKGTSVTLDLTTGEAACTAISGACPCVTANPGNLGPYTQGGALAFLPKGSTRIDELSVELHNETVPGGSGAVTSKAVLDGISFEGPLETSGLCAMYYAGKGTHVTDVQLGVAGPATAKGTPLESTTWDACLATVTSVGFSIGSPTEPARERVTLAAAGLVRTDRNIDPLTGLLVGKPLVTGWSFATNRSIATCSAAIPAVL